MNLTVGALLGMLVFVFGTTLYTQVETNLGALLLTEFLLSKPAASDPWSLSTTCYSIEETGSEDEADRRSNLALTRALALLQHAHSRSPALQVTNRLLAIASFEAGDYLSSEDLLDSIAPQYIREEIDQVRYAEYLYANQNYRGALIAYRQALPTLTDPRYEEHVVASLLKTADRLAVEGEKYLAWQLTSSALDLDPGNVYALLQRVGFRQGEDESTNEDQLLSVARHFKIDLWSDPMLQRMQAQGLARLMVMEPAIPKAQAFAILDFLSWQNYCTPLDNIQQTINIDSWFSEERRGRVHSVISRCGHQAKVSRLNVSLTHVTQTLLAQHFNTVSSEIELGPNLLELPEMADSPHIPEWRWMPMVASWNWNDGSFVGGWDCKAIVNGHPALRITGFWIERNPKREGGRAGYLASRVELEPNSVYVMTFLYRTREGEASVWVGPRGARAFYLPNTEGEWQPAALLIATPADPELSQAIPLFNNWGVGTVWFASPIMYEVVSPDTHFTGQQLILSRNLDLSTNHLEE